MYFRVEDDVQAVKVFHTFYHIGQNLAKFLKLQQPFRHILFQVILKGIVASTIDLSIQYLLYILQMFCRIDNAV